MSSSVSVLGVWLIAAAATFAGCEGPSAPSVVTDEPVCKDFKQAGDLLKGGLKHPVRLKIMNGKNVVATVMLYGLSESAASPTRFLLPDSNEKYALEWAQCKTVRAPTTYDPRDKDAKRQAGGPAGQGNYDCTEADVYEKGELVTKKGAPSTHEIKMASPPDATCW